MSDARRGRSGVLAKLCALTLFVLTLSPFTAPFQTCDFADLVNGTATDELMMVTAPTVAQPPSSSDDEGAVVPPRASAVGRLMLAPVSAIVISNVVARPPVTSLAPLVTLLPNIGGSAFPLTILRV